MQRKNGFTQHINCEQITGASIAVVMICIYCIIIIPVLKQPLQIINSVIYSSLIFGTISFGISSAYIDPTDLGTSVDNSKYCTVCKRNVETNSKHCGQCNRCVVGFDHHCGWVNNCIGSKNYRHFVLAIVFLQLFMMYQLASSIYIIYALTNCPQDLERLFQKELVYTMMAVSLLVSSFFIVSNGILIGFHVFLYFKKITTYEFIVQRRKDSAVRYRQKVRSQDDIKKYYEPYVALEKSDESMELVRAPNFLEKSLDATKVMEK